MKKILLLLFFISTSLFAQQFEKQWDKVVTFENEGKIKSADAIVDQIQKKAVAKNDEAQIIKTFFYKSKYRQVLDENAKSKILNDLQKQISQVSIPSKSILNLIYAKCLIDYDQYALDETAVAVDTVADIDETKEINIDTEETAVPKNEADQNYVSSDTDLNPEEKILSSYAKTLENEAILKNTPLSNYELIFDFFTLEKFKKENLYDYLLKENISFYKSRIYQWEMESKDYEQFKSSFLGSTDVFTKLNLDFIKDKNLKKTLSLYQKLEIDSPTFENQLERLKFCNEYLLKSDEDFLNTLISFEKEAKEPIQLQKIQLEKATIYAKLASKETHADYNNKALIELEKILTINNNSNTYKQATQGKEELLSKSIRVAFQKYIYNKENTRAFIHYKNTNNLVISFFKINYKKIAELHNTPNKLDSLVSQIVTNKKPTITKKYDLIDKKNYFEYTTEIVLPQLETGSYLVYFESETDSKVKKGFGYETITASNISVVANTKGDTEYYTVIDRKTGKPMENVSLKSSYFDIKTNAEGLATYKQKEKTNNYYNNFPIKLATENDTILINKEYVSYSTDYSKNNSTEQAKGKIEFYLDRAIYRPGQTVYYKGIAFQKTNNKSNIVPNTSFKISIQDPNSSTFKEFDVTTNEFGSFSGEFVLPKTGLTGDFRIQAKKPDDYKKDSINDKINNQHPFWDKVDFEYSSTYFKVEEYKRPKFEVTFEPKKESFQVNQSVSVKGTAKAFAGNTISDAKVTYTITRFTSYFRNYYNNDPEEILVSSETKTDANGKFTIDFIAKPSPKANKNELPIFNYRVNATITDSNGETHTAITTINVGYHNLALYATIPNSIETKNKNDIALNSTNLNGEFTAVKGEIKIYFVSPFLNKFKPRVFQQPEITTISDADFEKLFPYEMNSNEASKKQKETIVFTKKVDTEKDKKLALDFISNYQSGNYKAVFSAKDSYDNPIETTSIFKIIQSKNKLNPNVLFTVEQINKDPKKDGFVSIQVRSIIDTLYIHTSGNYKNTTFYEKNTVLENHQATLTIPLQKDLEKLVNISFESVFENETFNNQLLVLIKQEEPKLEFSVESFRNKIQPGSSENWSFQLKTSNTKSEVEVLASMYDRSLDQFSKKEWESLRFYEYNNNRANFRTSLGFDKTSIDIKSLNLEIEPFNFQNEETQLNWFGFNFNNSIKGDSDAVFLAQPTGDSDADVVEEITIVKNLKVSAVTLPPPPPKTDMVKFVKPVLAKAEEIVAIRGGSTISGNGNNILYIIDGEIASEEVFKRLSPDDILSIDILKDAKATALYGEKGKNGVILITTKKALAALNQVKARTNLSETAFFYPNLKTDAKGNVSFNFTSPEALTAWKLRLFAHNKDAVTGYLEKSVITQKELMVTPNFPRFFREKDSITITAKITNITKEAKVGMAVLQLFDATTMQPIDAKMLNTKTTKNFSITAFGNTTASWKIFIPEGVQGVQYRVLAKAGNFSDGEENVIPVLTNSMLVTESIPIWVRDNSKKEYSFENLKNNTSTTLRNHQFTLEYTSNPSWMAIQSLPYLMEFEHECAEQTFARFYANALAGEIINSNPKIASLFETWRKNGKLNSKLEENEELKSMLLAETPWVNDAKTEDEKKQQLATLFDLEKMKNAQEATFNKLKQKQKPSGGFAWFDGSNENEYITRHILAGFGHLEKLTKNQLIEEKIKQITATGIPYLDKQFLENNKQRIQNLKRGEKLIWLNPNSDLHYLYTRSFYLKNYPLSDSLKKVSQKYLDKIREDWLGYTLYEKGMAALSLNRFGETASAKKIIESLKETSSNNEDWGMYWIANKAGWYWYQAPIETQALLIEAFAEVGNDSKSVDAMKVWLLKNKQTKNWPTTKSTTEAVYALLMQGTDWLSVKDNTIFKIGDEKILSKKLTANDKEAETGYLKLNWKADEIKKDMATIVIENKSKVPGYGGIYWQYFEDLDKIKNNNDTSLSVSKELYLKKSTDKGEKHERITNQNSLAIGDLVTVRLVISSTEDMDFVHLKDMRASCFEPVDVLSGYQYKGGLGFYKSTKDAATHFFFDAINKGTYVLEYDIRVNNSGDFSNGITTIESMYAPEFSSHTKGTRVQVK